MADVWPATLSGSGGGRGGKPFPAIIVRDCVGLRSLVDHFYGVGKY